MQNRIKALALSSVFTLAALPAAINAQANPEVANDRFIVQFKKGQFAAGMGALNSARANVKAKASRFDMAAARLTESQVSALSKNPHVEFIEPDLIREPYAQEIPFGIPLVQADQVSDQFASNRTVCVIDSGYEIANPDLNFAGASGTSDPGGAGDVFNPGDTHGTHVAGTIVALNNNVGVVGVLPSGTVNVHSVKVFGDDGLYAFSSDLVAAVQICADVGANVINMSLGGSFKSRAEENAFNSFNAQGILSIAAAGNDGNTRLSYPASYDSVVSVAAIDENKVVADFSQQNAQVELSGPGVNVKSAYLVGTGRDVNVAVNGTGIAANEIEGSPEGDVTGALADCGLGDAPCTGVSGQVCLISRGDVSFADKVLNCQAGGGIGAVVFNNEPGPLFGTLGGVATTIPSVGVSDTDGAALLGQLGSNANLVLAASDFGFLSGTSMATPHVAGVATLVWSHFPECTNTDIRNALNATAEDLGDAGRDNAYGFGLVQAKAAFDLLTANGCGGAGGGDTGGGNGGGGKGGGKNR